MTRRHLAERSSAASSTVRPCSSFMPSREELVDERDAEADEHRLGRGAALLAGDQHLGAGGPFGVEQFPSPACRAA